MVTCYRICLMKVMQAHVTHHKDYNGTCVARCDSTVLITACRVPPPCTQTPGVCAAPPEVLCVAAAGGSAGSDTAACCCARSTKS